MQKGSAELPVSWLLSREEEQLEFHVSICAGEFANICWPFRLSAAP